MFPKKCQTFVLEKHRLQCLVSIFGQKRKDLIFSKKEKNWLKKNWQLFLVSEILYLPTRKTTTKIRTHAFKTQSSRAPWSPKVPWCLRDFSLEWCYRAGSFSQDPILWKFLSVGGHKEQLIAFLLHTQGPWVCFSVYPRNYLLMLLRFIDVGTP